MKYLDMTGRRFGRLTVMWPAGYGRRGQVMWASACDCGAINISVKLVDWTEAR